jgi:hypothetical protein
MCAADNGRKKIEAELNLLREGTRFSLADRLADAVEEIKQIYDKREYGNGWRGSEHSTICSTLLPPTGRRRNDTTNGWRR